MNIHRFILPATAAATLHVALFWALPHEEYVRLIPVELGPTVSPPPPPDNEPPVPNTEEKDPNPAPFKPLNGGPSRPELDEVPFIPKPDGPNIPIDPHPRKIWVKGTKIIPGITGPGGDGPTGISGPTIYREGDLDRLPNAKIQIAPEYPFAMKSGGIDGSVTVEFDVDREGKVVAARVRNSTHGEFEAPTLRAVLKWRFEPGRKNGRPVPFRMVVPVDFHLNPD